MVTKKTNEKSYNETEIVNYYSKFISAGLFRYEEILIDNYFFAGGKTLDIGCGAGRVTIPLKLSSCRHSFYTICGSGV